MHDYGLQKMEEEQRGLETSLSTEGQRVSVMFPSSSVIILALVFKFMVHFELVVVYSMSED